MAVDSVVKIRRRVWEIVEAAKVGDKASRVFDIAILILIFTNVLAVVFGTVESVQQKYGTQLAVFETFSVIVFTVEYILRLWSCVTDDRFSNNYKGRLKFSVQIMSVIDLLAILPFYLPFVGLDLRFVRVFRLLRIFRIAKAARYYSSLHLIQRVIVSKKEELVLTTAVMFFLLVISASLMYYCENAVQPKAFPNIPATMWWAVATLTTVGYGDVYPVTVLGKIFASVIAILGIGMFALPTGILGSGFVEEIQKKKKVKRVCPHCGKEV